jgi:sulfocyanin
MTYAAHLGRKAVVKVIALVADTLSSLRNVARALGGVPTGGSFALLVAGYVALRAPGVGPAGSLLASGKLGKAERVFATDFRAGGADSSFASVLAEAEPTSIADTKAARPDTTTVNRYLSYDASARSVALTLVAAANSARGGFNFNGGSAGDQTITVPLGWTIDIDFRNHDAVPHSALVMAVESPLPSIPEKPAFPRAYTSHLIDGLPAQTGHDGMRFTADQAGDYLIACGVPGHALSGMFIRFVVSAEASAPSDTGTIATP